MTKRTLECLGGLHPRFRPFAEGFFHAAAALLEPQGVKVEIISGLRSYAAQAALYAQGRTKPGKVVTKARPGSSWHNYGLAIDLGLFAGGVYLDSSDPPRAGRLYALLAQLAEERGLEWAGRWKSFPEGPHFQRTFGHTLTTAREALAAAGFDVRRMMLPG